MHLDGIQSLQTGLATFALAGILAASLGCTAGTGPTCPDGFQQVVRYELYFGLDHADGHSVTQQQWDAFLADTITPRFPLGLSALEVKGQWQRPDGVIERENTRLVVLVRPPPLADGMALIDEISHEYQRRFDQDPAFRSISMMSVSGSIPSERHGANGGT